MSAVQGLTLSLTLCLSLSLSSDTSVVSLAMQRRVALALLHLSPSIFLSVLPITGSPSSFCFDFLSILLPLTDSVISFILCSTLSLVIPSLKSFCPPCGFPFPPHFIDNFSIVSVTTFLLTLVLHMFVEIYISISTE